MKRHALSISGQTWCTRSREALTFDSPRHNGDLQVLLISTYELGRQPFGIASPAAWLRREGHEVSVADLSLECLPQQKIREAEFVAFYLPMHTATRLAASAIGKVKAINPAARLC